MCDLGAGVPSHSELEPSGGVPHGLGWASEAGGVTRRGVRWATVRMGLVRFDGPHPRWTGFPMLDMLSVVTAADALAHTRNALRLAGEAAGTAFVWAYLVLTVALVRSATVTPSGMCGTTSSLSPVAVSVLLMLGAVAAVIVQRDSRLARGGGLWPPPTWLRAAPAILAILTSLFVFAFR